ncbi:MAG: two-component system, NtrC family, sensor kinase [Acidobacteriota bacterium]|jgi:GAF domain-containing protein|nr:two-component system, NtrC family, sensor kinase [Acidobacteriota bacterium]
MNIDNSLQAAIVLLETLTIDRIMPGDLDEALQCIVLASRNIFEGDICTIIAINPITRQPHGKPVSASSDTWNGKLEFTPGAVDVLSAEKGLLFVEDVRSITAEKTILLHVDGVGAFMGILLRTRSNMHPLAVLTIGFRRPQQFSQDIRILIQILADKAALILQSTWSQRRYQWIAHIGKEINQSPKTFSILFQSLSARIKRILDLNYFFMLAVHNPQQDSLDYYMLSGGEYQESRNRPIRGTCASVIKNKQTVWINHLTLEGESLSVQPIDIFEDESEDPESLIFVPLVFHGVCLGVLSIQDRRPAVYTNEDRNILELLGHHVALAISNMHLFSNLNRLNQTGQRLVRELNSGRTLMTIVEQMRAITGADVVNLYPYSQLSESFEFPPRSSGVLLQPEVALPNYSRSDDLISLALKKGVPSYARNSSTLYKKLGGVIKGPGVFEKRENIASTAALPLKIGNEPVGVLFVNFRQRQQFDVQQQLLIESLANYAALAIGTSREFEELTRRRMRELEVLRNIDQEVSRTLELQQVLTRVLELTGHFWLAAEKGRILNAAILLYDQKAHELEVHSALGPNARVRLGKRISLAEGQGITNWVFEHKVPALVGDVHTDEEWRERYLEVDTTTVSELDVPLLDENDEVVGIISYENSVRNAFSQEDQDFLMMVSKRVVLAIRNAQAYERERKLVEELRALHEIDQKIVMQLDNPDKVMVMVLVDAMSLTGAETGDLHLHEGGRLGTTYVTRREGRRIHPPRRLEGDEIRGLPRGIVTHVAETRKSYILRGDPAQDPHYMGGGNIKSEVAIPLVSGGELIGVLNLESSLQNAFSDDDIRPLEVFAGQAVIAIQKAQTYVRAEEESKRFRLLLEAGRELSEITDMSQVELSYESIIRIAGEHNDAQSVIRRYQPDTNQLVLKKVGNLRKIPPFETIKTENVNWLFESWRAENRRTLQVSTRRSLPEAFKMKISDPAINSLVITAVEVRDKFYGTFGLSHEKEGYFKEADVKLIEGLAQQLALTIHRLNAAQEQQEAERRGHERKLMSEMGHLAFEVTHRLGNDLPPIKARSDKIRKSLQEKNHLSTDMDGYLRFINKNIQRSLALTKKLKRDVAKFREKGTINKPLTTIPTRRLIEDIRDALPDDIPENIDIVVRVAKDTGDVRVILEDTVNAIYNLIINAIEAMPRGGRITIRAKNAERYVQIKVKDNGPGISADVLPKIFNLFFTTKKETGSGFGLWSSRLNILSNGGDIEVSSMTGKGATFTVTLPRV